MIRITKKLSQNDCNVVIAQDINDKGAKQYLGFRDYDDVFPYIEKQDEKCFHEVMVGSGNRRPYFDYDKAQTAEEFENTNQNMGDFVDRMLIAISVSSVELFGVKFGYGEVVFTECHRADKFSKHVHIPKYFTSLSNMKLLFLYVDEMLKLNWGMDGLDNQVYSKNQTMRLLGCHKKGKPEQVLTEHVSAWKKVDTLVGYMGFGGKAKELVLTAENQAAVNEFIELQEGKRLEAAIYNPKDSKFYGELCDGLAPTRFNDYGYWNKIILALGHENAGLQVALAFSKKSHKFDRYAVEKLYERGRVGFEGKPLKCGTLMAYLKENNPELFRKLIKENSSTGFQENTSENTRVWFQDQELINTILGLQSGGAMDNDDSDLYLPERKSKKEKN